MNEIGYELLRDAIIMQAIDDYCLEVKRLVWLNTKAYAINKIVADGKKGKRKKEYTLEEAEKERLYRIAHHEDRMKAIERFFDSEWYRNMCAIDGKYIIKKMKDKAIDDMVNMCIFKLKKVKAKNLNSKVSQMTLRQFEMLKSFLLSDWLKKLTERDAETILQRMKSEANCMFCDFSV